MAYPAPVPVGGATAFTFLLAAQTGISVQTWGRKADSKLVDVYNAAVGYTDSSTYHDFKAMYDVKGVLSGNTGIAAASPGVVITLADVISGNGVTSGGIYTQNTSEDHQAEQNRDFTVSARQLPGIN
jgi:hypothetical protein